MRQIRSLIPFVLWNCAVLAFTGAIAVSAQNSGTPPAERFTGKLDDQLSPDMVHIAQRVLKVGDTKIAFKPAVDKGSKISGGEFIDPTSASRKSKLYLVEPKESSPFLAVDLDADNVIGSSERFTLKQTSRPNDLYAILRIPIRNLFYKDFPVFVMYKRGFRHPKLQETDRLVLQSVMALAYGSVDVKGRDVRFMYPFVLEDPKMSTTDGLFGVDSDGDGEIRNEQFSPETSYATGTELVFPLGNMFVSTENIDLVKNEITVRERERSEYLRHDLELGGTMPDFSFIDFDEKPRKLYEFKGKYVLIDFWGAWCHDCTLETPYHVEALKRFRKRGFDILSLNSDEDINVAKSYMSKNGMTWTQATNDSIRNLVEVTYRIQEYPSTILIGPDAKVLVLDQNRLRGERLLETLDSLLP